MMIKNDEKVEKKGLIKNLEETLVWVKETEELQTKLREAYRVPYPVSLKVNIGAGILFYIVYTNNTIVGATLLLGWFGWQIIVNFLYHMLGLRRRMPEIVQWKDVINLNLEKLEENSKVPREFWYSAAIEYFIKTIKSGKAKTIEECIELAQE